MATSCYARTSCEDLWSLSTLPQYLRDPTSAGGASHVTLGPLHVLARTHLEYQSSLQLVGLLHLEEPCQLLMLGHWAPA